jgi:hypothetical protein
LIEPIDKDLSETSGYPAWRDSSAFASSNLDAFAAWRGGSEEERQESRFEDAIETDHDSFTLATTTAGRKRLIVKETHSFPELLCRYGLMERFELRLGLNYEVGRAGSGSSSATVEKQPPGSWAGAGEQPQVYCMKFRVTDQHIEVPGGAFSGLESALRPILFA